MLPRPSPTSTCERCRFLLANGEATELAYKQGLDCSRLDCGCERGWSGFDSHRATTTVRVVDRPDLTVHGLASQLAVSLFDGDWIPTANASDELVSMFVDEIIEIANHFGEGAVLERDGEWTRVRDGSNGAIIVAHEGHIDSFFAIAITVDPGLVDSGHKPSTQVKPIHSANG